VANAGFARRNRGRDLAAAAACVGGTCHRADEHDLESGRTQMVGGAVHGKIFEFFLDQDGDALRRHALSLAHAVWECTPRRAKTKDEGRGDNVRMPNRLADEKSPYLLQHADNPVDWYPWGEEAFAAARAADKPIFLSVVDASLKKKHVMAHESFESVAVAE